MAFSSPLCLTISLLELRTISIPLQVSSAHEVMDRTVYIYIYIWTLKRKSVIQAERIDREEKGGLGNLSLNYGA